MRRLFAVAVLTSAALLTLTPAVAHADQASAFASAVSTIESLPYQAAYAPAGADTAFPSNPAPVPNTAPAEDYTTGSIPGDPDAPSWPPWFVPKTITESDGTQIQGMVDIQATGTHPAVLVVHGFNTHGYYSVIRWAAMLAANGYDVAAFDQRDYYFENAAGQDANRMQTFGWKESVDVLAAGTWLSQQPGVTSVGILGFSEGAQNTVLALSQDTHHVFSAGITFSGPADQDTQVYSTAVPPNCQTSAPGGCTYPATDALIALVVEPVGTYDDPCQVLNAAATQYGTTAYDILTHETAMHAQTSVSVPLLNFYADDDSLVNPVDASLMAAYESGDPLQRTILIAHGEHAYFFDRWWDQMAILTYFKSLLGTTSGVGITPTVNQTPGGATLSTQEVAYPQLSRAQADSNLAPYICDTSQPAPGLASAEQGSALPEGSPLGMLGAAGIVVAGVTVAVRRRRTR